MNIPSYKELTIAQFDALIERIQNESLRKEDHVVILEVMQAVLWMGEKLEENQLTLQKLRKIFGLVTSTEKLKNLDEESSSTATADPEEHILSDEEKDTLKKAKNILKGKKKKPKKRAGADLENAEIIDYVHPNLKKGETCPSCKGGALYNYGKGSFIKVTGNPPLHLQVHRPEKLRCSACQEIFTAPMPQYVHKIGLGDAAACAVAALFRYHLGIPFERSSKLQKTMDMALSPSQHWELCKEMAYVVQPVYNSLYKLAATGRCLHNDDTAVKILSLMKENQHLKKENKHKRKGKKLPAEQRQGMQTTGILSLVSTHRIFIFLHGRKHAGENLQEVLKQRPLDLIAPIQMCDALSRNAKQEVQTELCYCLIHARRNFYDAIPAYSDIAQNVIQQMSPIFFLEQKILEEEKSPAERLLLHKEKSLPILEAVKQYCSKAMEEKLFEPNSVLGKACTYLFKHWNELIKFTQVEGAPIHNNDMERGLKTQVLQRKNSLFFKTEEGARVASILSSVIETAKAENISVFHYFKTLMEYSEKVSYAPENWLPWNYKQQLEKLR